ncbi:uncharacterized protein LOC141665460 [Apium graveolens]|uniref:uncharacterized protein LOC141665460 n=1 Tax=Apium graveolens TaxID=4045 RepID=UPI003D799415
MASPKFDVGFVFSSAALFRNAVITQSILPRRLVQMKPTRPIPALHKKVVNDWRCDISVHVVVEMVLEDAAPGEERRRFKRIYICIGPVREGFKAGCRPIIGLDGYHLKDPYDEQLLATVGTNTNDGMYPIAWVVVEAGNTDAWNWFLTLLADDGLINALVNVVPNAEHRFRVMHLYNDMKKVYKGRGLMSLVWLEAKATTEYSFNKHVDALRKLMEKPRSQWTRSTFLNTCMSDVFVNNHCEVFNNRITNFRDLPIVGLLQAIHKAVIRRIQVRRDKMLHTYQLNLICPNAMRKVSKYVKYSGGVMVQWSCASKYLCTMTDGGHEIVVDLDKKTYSCKKYDLTGLPC